MKTNIRIGMRVGVTSHEDLRLPMPEVVGTVIKDLIWDLLSRAKDEDVHVDWTTLSITGEAPITPAPKDDYSTTDGPVRTDWSAMTVDGDGDGGPPEPQTTGPIWLGEDGFNLRLSVRAFDANLPDAEPTPCLREIESN